MKKYTAIYTDNWMSGSHMQTVTKMQRFTVDDDETIQGVCERLCLWGSITHLFIGHPALEGDETKTPKDFWRVFTFVQDTDPYRQMVLKGLRDKAGYSIIEEMSEGICFLVPVIPEVTHPISIQRDVLETLRQKCGTTFGLVIRVECKVDANNKPVDVDL